MDEISAFESFVAGRLKEETLHYLFSTMSVDQLTSLAQTSWTMHELVKSYTDIAWDINTFMRVWFRPQAVSFRQVLHVCGAVIGGSQALQYFSREKFESSDLNLFVRIGGAHDLGAWLFMQGYRYRPSSIQSAYEKALYLQARHIVTTTGVITSSDGLIGVCGTHYFYKYAVEANGNIKERRVSVTITDMDPVHHILFNGNCTALVNFITADKAVCVFPTETIIERTAYVTMAHQKPGATTLDWISKYQGRGYRVLGAKDIPGTSTSIYGARHTEDSLSWVIPFCTDKFPIAEAIFGNQPTRLEFEVLPKNETILPAWAFLRVAEPVVWRRTASGRFSP